MVVVVLRSGESKRSLAVNPIPVYDLDSYLIHSFKEVDICDVGEDCGAGRRMANGYMQYSEKGESILARTINITIMILSNLRCYNLHPTPKLRNQWHGQYLTNEAKVAWSTYSSKPDCLCDSLYFP